MHCMQVDHCTLSYELPEDATYSSRSAVAWFSDHGSKFPASPRPSSLSKGHIERYCSQGIWPGRLQDNCRLCTWNSWGALSSSTHTQKRQRMALFVGLMSGNTCGELSLRRPRRCRYKPENVSNSACVLAETSVRSPWHLYIFIT